MPYIDGQIGNATLDDYTVIPVGSRYACLRKNVTGRSWSVSDTFAVSGTVTFPNISGWAWRLPPYTFETYEEFDKDGVSEFSSFGDRQDWVIASGVSSISESFEFGTFGKETRVDRNIAVATSIVSKTVDYRLRSNDTLEFRIHLPSNASALSIILHSGPGSARYQEFSPLVNDWNIVLIEVDQPTATTAPWDANAVDKISISVTFSDAVASHFVISSMNIDRTAKIAGEIRWQVSLNGGTTWLGWNGSAWASGIWCHKQWIERRLSSLSPSSDMQWRVRCRLVPSDNLKYSPRVSGFICAVDLDSTFHAEEDMKRSVLRAIESTTVQMRGLAQGDGTVNVDLLTNYTNPTVTAVYLGGLRTVDTTNDLFVSQGTAIEVDGGLRIPLTLSAIVASGSRVVIHYTANVSVKISSDRFLIEAQVPEIDLVFGDRNNDSRHSRVIETFTNRSLGYVWTGISTNCDSYKWQIYCTANDDKAATALESAVRDTLFSGITSDATGFSFGVGDILTSVIQSERASGLYVKFISADGIIVRWHDLALTRIRQARTLGINVGSLPRRGYTNV